MTSTSSIITLTPPPTLLVIDLQTGLVDGDPTDPTWGTRSTPTLTTNVALLLSTWRVREWPVIHIHHEDAEPDHPLNKAHPATFAVHPCALPLPSEPILYKGVGSGFIDPKNRLEERLRENGGQVVVIGMDGAQCVNSNVRTADDLGFKVVVAHDACSSYEMDDYRSPGGKLKIGAEETHRAAMGMLANAFATVVGTAELMEEIGAVSGFEG